MPSPVVIMPGRMVGVVRSPGGCGISRLVVAIEPDAPAPVVPAPVVPGSTCPPGKVALCPFAMVTRCSPSLRAAASARQAAGSIGLSVVGVTGGRRAALYLDHRGPRPGR